MIRIEKILKNFHKLMKSGRINKVVKLIGDETTNKHSVKNKPIYNIIILFMYLFVYTQKQI